MIVTKEDIEGTAVILRGPQYTANLNAVGDHFHYISDDGQFGGHALNLTVTEGVLEVQQIRKFEVWLPDSEDFKEAELSE